MKKLLLLNTVLAATLVIYIAFTVALAIYVFTFVPPIGRAPIEPTPTWPSEGGWLAPGIWVGPGPTDTPGPSPTPPPTRTPRPSPTSCPCGSCYIGRGTYGCCPCPTVTPMPVATTTAEIWQPPSTCTPTPLYSPTPTPTPSCDLTAVYLRDTNNAEGFAAFTGEHANTGSIYTEGAYVYGEVAVRIGNREYHYGEKLPMIGPSLNAGLPSSYRLEVKFSEPLIAATEGVEPGFHPGLGRFWAGILDCNSATPPDKPYKIEVTLYKEGEIQEHTEITFFVVDDPLCGSGSEEPDECDDPCPVRP